MEQAYRASFLKSFRRQIDERYFSFIIVDAVFDKTAYLEEFWSYAKLKGFEVRLRAVYRVCRKLIHSTLYVAHILERLKICI